MKQKVVQEFPPGWNEKRVRALIAHYDQQTEDESAAEIESAPEVWAPELGETWMTVPNQLVERVTRMIKELKKNGSAVQSRRKRPASKQRRRKPSIQGTKA